MVKSHFNFNTSAIITFIINQLIQMYWFEHRYHWRINAMAAFINFAAAHLSLGIKFWQRLIASPKANPQSTDLKTASHPD
jgi:hypothetical protein